MLEDKIISLIEPTLNNINYELVRVKQINNDLIQIMIDKDGGINIDDCTKVAGLVSNMLYVANVASDYRFEVSSPGLDRPLVKPEHFTKFIGSKVKLTTHDQGKKKFIGKLIEFDGDFITVELEKEQIKIAFSQIQSANLVFEDNKKGKRKD